MELVRIFRGPQYVFTGRDGEKLMFLCGVVKNDAGETVGAAIFSNGDVVEEKHIDVDAISDTAWMHVAYMLKKRGEGGSPAHRNALGAFSWKRIRPVLFGGGADTRRWPSVIAYWDGVVRSEWERNGPGCPIPYE
jgi:hypothetical protein